MVKTNKSKIRELAEFAGFKVSEAPTKGAEMAGLKVE